MTHSRRTALGLIGAALAVPHIAGATPPRRNLVDIGFGFQADLTALPEGTVIHRLELYYDQFDTIEVVADVLEPKRPLRLADWSAKDKVITLS